MRKKAGFEITDRIHTYYRGPSSVDEVMSAFSAYIMQETLSEELFAGEAADGAYNDTQKVDGMEVVLGVRQV